MKKKKSAPVNQPGMKSRRRKKRTTKEKKNKRDRSGKLWNLTAAHDLGAVELATKETKL